MGCRYAFSCKFLLIIFTLCQFVAPNFGPFGDCFDLFNIFHNNWCKEKVEVESRSLDQMYTSALTEGGKLVVYAGGTMRGQQDLLKQAFEQRFPNISIAIPVDYSVFQGPRVDLQMVTPEGIVPDIVMLQTLQDFARWKWLGKLVAYKPRGWDKVYGAFRDQDGFYTGLNVMVLGSTINKNLVSSNASDRSLTFGDLLKPEFSNGNIGTVDPSYDDAVLFLYKQIIDKFGWGWLSQFAKQNPRLICGGIPLAAMVENGTVKVGIGSFGSFPNNANTATEFVMPADNDPFTTYAMYAAILKGTKHPEAAKLFMSWQLDTDGPSSVQTWSVRTDVQPKQNRRQIWDYPNSSHQKFVEFMSNIDGRQRFGRQIALFLDISKCVIRPLETDVRPQ
ncbi:hypothetical protein niasHT_023801 [Heterodera trifolii]|uniref:Uncharacterized protein n=1 Tax=Heterodera trifolii TaxID=157864 RepID=A0ABD2JS81_9BILA